MLKILYFLLVHRKWNFEHILKYSVEFFSDKKTSEFRRFTSFGGFEFRRFNLYLIQSLHLSTFMGLPSPRNSLAVFTAAGPALHQTDANQQRVDGRKEYRNKERKGINNLLMKKREEGITPVRVCTVRWLYSTMMANFTAPCTVRPWPVAARWRPKQFSFHSTIRSQCDTI